MESRRSFAEPGGAVCERLQPHAEVQKQRPTRNREEAVENEAAIALTNPQIVCPHFCF